jgi:hypothetical protein
VVLPAGHISTLAAAVIPQKTAKAGGYVMIHYTFADITTFLHVLRRAGMRTPFYARLPRNLEELLTRRICAASTEMTHLCVLPIVSPAPIVSRDLAGDIERIAATEKRAPK